MRSIRLAVGGAALALLASCGGGNSDGTTTSFPPEVVQRLDAAIAGEMRANDLPSVAVSITVPGEGEYTAVRGVANLDTGTPRRLGDPFRIASITKTFIGTAILQLADRGLLRLDDPLSRWYPDFPRAAEITVDDLLRMRSGIPDSLDKAFLAEFYADLFIPVTADEAIARSAARPTEFIDADTRTVYTNINFVLLEEIVRLVTGLDIATYLDRNVHDPLGMTETVYADETTPLGRTHGYAFDADTQAFRDVTRLDPTPAGGAGAIISTIADLRRYGRALCTGTLLRPDTHAERLRGAPLEEAPPFVYYGGGLVRFGRFCGHNGTIFGYSSELWYLPERDALIVINVNRLDLDDESKSLNLFFYITKILFPDLVDWPQIEPPGS